MPPEDFINVVSLMSRVALEGELLPPDTMPELQSAREMDEFMREFAVASAASAMVARGAIEHLEALLFNLRVLQDKGRTLRHDLRKAA